MKQLLTVWLGLLPLFLLGQTQDSATISNQFSIGLTVSPEIGYRDISGTNKSNQFLLTCGIPGRDFLESAKLG
ncbi:MAG: hypothetical protein GY760_29390 [Deltaproteobacteria bacterium]|nr:hypothetical protein [Deltaproteobacteria bacterium]